jgi:hypothetical protein
MPAKEMSVGPEQAPPPADLPFGPYSVSYEQNADNELFFDMHTGQPHKVGSHLIVSMLEAEDELMRDRPDFVPRSKSFMDTDGNYYRDVLFLGIDKISDDGRFQQHRAILAVEMKGAFSIVALDVSRIAIMALSPTGIAETNKVVRILPTRAIALDEAA